MNRLFLALILIIILCGCSLVTDVLKGRDQITGTWQFQDKTLGPLLLSFSDTGQFEVDANADGKKDIWGRFRLFENRITFIDDQPRVITDCYEPGFKTYTIEKDVLIFREYADQCKPRKFILKHPMVRVED